MFHHVINYQHVPIIFAIIIGVVLQEYKEYKYLPKVISGTTHYIKCLNIEYINLHTFSILCLTRDFIRQGHTREKGTAQPVRAARRSIKGNGRGEAVTSRRYGNCLTASKQGACTAKPVRTATRFLEDNGRGEAVTSRRYGNCLTASKQGSCTAKPVRAATRFLEDNGRGEAKKLAASSVLRMAQEIVSRHEHNMLSLLYATCLKLLVYFFILIDK